METKPVTHPTGPGYEPRDANPRSVVKFGVGLFVTLVVVLVLAARLFHFFAATQSLGPPASPFANTRVLPPAPRLQVEPGQDLRQLRQSEDEKLGSYGWVDRKAGIVRIPVDRAMQLLLQRGFPVRGETSARPARK